MRHCADRVYRRAFFRNTSAYLVLSILMAPMAGHATDLGDFKLPERNFIDPLGVDFANTESNYLRSDTLMSVGDLSWTFRGHWVGLEGDYRGNVYIDPDGVETDVRFGDSVTAFINSSGNYVNASGTSSTLSACGSNLCYTETDGTVYTFSTTLLLSILKPNGLKITLNFTSSGDCTSITSTTCAVAYASAVTNTGYAFKFDATNNKIWAVNLLAHSCDGQALSCDAYDNYLTKTSAVSDPDIGTSLQFADSMGNNWRYLVKASYAFLNGSTGEREKGPRVLWAYKTPSGYWMKLNRSNSMSGDITSVVDPRGTFTYTNVYNIDGTAGYAVTDPDAVTLFSVTKEKWFKDGLNRQTSYNVAHYYTSGAYGPYTRLISATRSEGDYTTYGYDNRGNVTSVTNTPKSGSGLSPTTIYAGYDATCSNLKTCNQPNWIQDAKGNQTDYTYDATHGGVLTVTLPANGNGLRRRTYNTYTSFDTGNGLIYRPTRSETCGLTSSQLALTACPNTVDTAATVTDYGTSTTAPKTYKSFQPYSVTQTHGGTSPLSATTTYTYDNLGNVIVIDGPRTDVDDKVYKTYDLNRRVIFEIGVLPGGTGSPKRTVTRHWYDAAGKEWKTEVGYANTNATDGSDFVVTAFTRVTFDAAGRAIKTEQVQP